jgi:hypothetical protein
MTRAQGAPVPLFACEPWRDQPRTLRAPDLRLIIHARVAVSETRTSVSGSPNITAGFALGGFEGAMIQSALDPPTVNRTTRQIANPDVLDLCLAGGARLRINSARFRFDALGDRHAPTNHANAAALLALLTSLAPRAIVDRGFADFRCPPDVTRAHWSDTGSGTLQRATDAPAFDFYSAWSILLYRRFAGI